MIDASSALSICYFQSILHRSKNGVILPSTPCFPHDRFPIIPDLFHNYFSPFSSHIDAVPYIQSQFFSYLLGTSDLKPSCNFYPHSQLSYQLNRIKTFLRLEPCTRHVRG